MVINKKIIKELENTYRAFFPNDLKRYLLVKYAEKPFPYEYSEQDLYTNIEHDIRDYDAGNLDVTLKSPSERWREEREYLQNLYIEKSCEVHDLEEYVAKLEHMLLKHGIESSRMTEQRIGRDRITVYY
jgi:intein/homing endonuclease